MSSRPRRTKRSTKRLAIHWLLAAMLVLLNLASLPVVQPFTNLGPQDALAAPCPDPGTGDCETDLAVEMTGAATYTPGGTIEFTITITNTGLAAGEFDLVGATLVDSVPTEITDVTWECVATAGSDCGEDSGAGNDINTTYDILEGGTVTYTVTGTAPSAEPLPTLSNTATVSVPAEAIDLDASNDSATGEVAPAAAFSDLSISKVDDPDPVAAGGTLTYTIQVDNAGPDSAADATVVDTLPADVTDVTADGGAAWSCAYDAGTHEVTCTANGELPTGSAAPITVTVTAPVTPATLLNGVEVTSSTDTDTVNNTAIAETAVEALDWTPFICDGTGYIVGAFGGTNTTQLQQVNTSAQPFTFEPIGLVQSGFELNPLAYNPSDNLLYALNVTLSGGQATINGLSTVDATGEVSTPVPVTGLPSPAPGGGYISGDIAPDGSYYVYAAGDTVMYQIDLSTMTAVSITLSSAQTIGDFAAHPTDGLLYSTNASNEVITINPANGQVDITPIATGSLEGSGGHWFTADGTLMVYGGGDQLWQVDLDAPGGPAVISANTVPGVVRADAASCAARAVMSDLTISKVDDPDPVAANGTLTYTIQVVNNGPDGAADATVVDTLPAEVTFDSVDGGTAWTCAYDAGTHAVNCDANGVVGLGNAAPITVIVTAPTTPATLVNGVEVSSTTDTNPDNNTAEATTEMEALDWTPFVCDGSGYIIQNPGGGDIAQLYRVNTNQLPYTFDEVGVTNPFKINAIGYHPTQNVLYGWAWTGDPPTADVIGLVVVDATGEADVLGIPDGMPELASGVGTISNDGSTYYVLFTEATGAGFYAVDLATLTVTQIAIDASLPPFADLAERPGEPGVLYTVSNDDELVRITVSGATATVETVPINGIDPTGAVQNYGGAWFTAAGDLISYNNAGIVFQIDIDAAGGPTQVARVDDAPASSGNDGASCAAREVAADLAVSKVDDPDPVAAGGALTYTIQVVNNGPDSAADATVVDTLPAEVTFDSVDGGTAWTCAYDAGTHQVTCTANAEVALGNAAPIAVIVTAPTTPATLVNGVEVSSTTDTNTANNTAEATTEMEELDWTPWICDGRPIVALTPDAQTPSTFYWVDTTTDPYGFAEAVTQDQYYLNAIAFDEERDLVWAWAATLATPGSPGVEVGIVSIDADGTVSEPIYPTGLPAAAHFNTGAIFDGVYYLTLGNTSTIYAIDLQTFAVTDITLDQPFPNADFAVAPDGMIYAGSNSGDPLVRIDPSDGSMTPIAVPGLAPAAYGAAWINASGDLFLYYNPGTVYQVDLNLETAGDDPELIGSSAAQPTGGNDGTMCRDYVPFADLAITKTADPDPVAPADTLTYTLQVNNLGSDSAVDATVTDTLPADVTFISVDGGADWTCTYDDAAHTVNCTANAPVPLGATDPITVEVRAPLAQVSLVNEASTTSTTEDPNPDNNTSTITTEMEELDWTPFVCDGSGYVFQDLPPVGWQGQLYNVNTSVLPYTFDEVGPEHPNVLINAIGYHPTQNVIYGWALQDSNPNTGTDPPVILGLVRIDATGTITVIGIPTGVPETGYHVGAISNDGSTYFLRNGVMPADQIFAVDLATMTSEVITFDAAVPAIADIVESPTEPGVLYGTIGSDLVRMTVDLAANTGTVQVLPIDGYPTVAGVGAAWMTADGDFIAYDNGGQVIQVDLDDPANPVAIAVVEDTPSTGSNDGTSCTARDVMADLSVTKTADPDPVSPFDTLTYTLQVTNAGPDNAVDATVVDTLPAEVTFISVDGGADWTCTYDDGAHAVNCAANGAVPLGNTDPITVTVRAPQEPTDLVNVATVTSSTEDPDPNDNEDEITTTMDELDWTPFVCDGTGYIMQDPDIQAPNLPDAQLYRVNTSTLPYTFEEIGDTSSYFINAIGYHPTQNVLYGWASDADGVVGVVRIDATGEIDEIGIPDGVAEDAYHVGTISNDGSTYYLHGTGSGASAIYAVDLATMTSTPITLDQPLNINDFAERPGEPGVLYHVSNAGDLTRIVLDLTNNTGTVTITDVPGLIAEGAGFGAGWFTAAGDLIAYDNDGIVYQIDLDDPANPQIVATVENAPSSGSNDGAACAAREPSADLSIDKTADKQFVGAGETLTYTVQVFNAGPDSAEDVVVTDTLPAGIASVDSVTGDGWSCATTMTEIECTRDSLGLGNAPPITIVVTTADTGGELVNTATVTSNTEDPDEENNEDEEDTTNSAPDIVVDKVAEQITELQVGDTIEYFYYVTNIGNVELTNISLVDDLIGPVTCSLATLPANGGTMTCVGEYIVTQEDFDNGEITNVATVTGEDPTGEEVEDDDEETVPNEQEPDIDVDKFAEAVDDLVVGDVITYYYVVTNTGNVTLTNITAEDDLIASVDCPVTALAPGESTTCTAEYTVTQEDFDNGEITNHATVTGEDPDGEEVEEEDEETVPNDNQEPRILVDKVALNADDLQVNDVVDYEYIVTNVGNVTLTNVSVADNLIPSVACPVTELAPTESVTCTASYMVSQADVDAGEIVNVAVATGDDPDGDPIEDDDSERVEIEHEGDFEFDKFAEQTGTLEAGDVVEFSFEVVNSGDVPLTNITVEDDLIATVSCPMTELAPGGFMTCTAEYTVTQEDVDNGEIVNHATVIGETPDGEEIEEEDEETVETEDDPAIQLIKSADHSGSLDEGDVIDYELVVTNTGDVTLTNVEVNDLLIPNVSCPTTELDPDESMTCTGSYTVTRLDAIDGEVVNNATATGEDPDGDTVGDEDEETVTDDDDTDPGDPGDPGDDPDDDPESDIDIDKIAEEVDELVEGDVIDYAFIITNTGDTVLTDISVDDPLIPDNLTCPATVLDPGETMSCAGSYTVTEGDVENGEVVNHATVSGDPEGDDPPVEDEDEETVDPDDDPDDPESGIELDKVAEQVDSLVVGDVIDYQFIISNTGETVLTDISVDDPLIPDNLTCPATELDPGETMTCTGSYTVTEGDVENGEVVNHATVSGDPEGDDPPVEDDDEETVDPGDDDPDDTDPESGIAVDKVAEHTETLVVGDVIDYHFIITNTGDTVLTDVSVADPLIPDNLTCPATELDPGESMICTGSYTVTEGDVDQGEVVNNATVTAEDPDGDPVEEDDEETVPNDPAPAVTMDKVAEDVDELVEGDVVTYEFIVSNTGNVTLTDVEVTDLLIPDVSCPATELAPGETMTCTGEYTVTATDVDNGSIINVANVTADTPGDEDPPQDTDTEIVPQDDDPGDDPGDDGDDPGDDPGDDGSDGDDPGDDGSDGDDPGDDGSDDDDASDDGSDGDDDASDDADKDDDDDDPTYPQLPPNTGLDVESQAGSQDAGTRTMLMLIVLGSWMLVIGLAFNTWQRRRSMP